MYERPRIQQKLQKQHKTVRKRMKMFIRVMNKHNYALIIDLAQFSTIFFEIVNSEGDIQRYNT